MSTNKATTEIDRITLVVAIQAVDFRLTFLRDKIKNTGLEEDVGDSEDLLAPNLSTAKILRAAYERVWTSTSNLPAYLDLGLKHPAAKDLEQK